MADSDKESGEGGHRDWNFNIDSSQRELDLFFPIEDVRSAMKKTLPATKISKDAEEKVQECVSGFISVVTGVALDKCQREKRKAIDGDDLLYAITILGFQDYVEPLKIYLQILRDSEDEKTAMAGGRGDNAAVAGGGGNGSVEYGHDWGWRSHI